MPETRWLDGDETRAWLLYQRASTLVQDYLDQQLRRDAGITHSSYIVLAVLSETPDRAAQMSELAEWLTISRSRLSHTVTRLEASGWVTRRGHPTDRRGQLAVLTDQGLAFLTTIAPSHVDATRRAMFDHLTTEQVRQLTQISRTISDALTSEDLKDRPAGPPWRRR